MKFPGDPALAGYEVRLTAIDAGLDNWPTPATYVVKTDAHGDFESQHAPKPGPYAVALQTPNGWAAPSKALGAAGKAFDQYVVGGWPNKV